MQNYMDDIKTTANKLRFINLTDDWLVSVILARLNNEYAPFVMGLEASLERRRSLI